MAAYTSGRALGALLVNDAMSSDVQCCHASDPMDDALDSMNAAQVRRLPVVDEDDRVVGILSVADVLQALSTAKGKARRSLSDLVVDTLANVARPRELAGEPESILEPATRGVPEPAR